MLAGSRRRGRGVRDRDDPGGCISVDHDPGSRTGVSRCGGHRLVLVVVARDEQRRDEQDDQARADTADDGRPPGVGRGVLHHGLHLVERRCLGPVVDCPGPPRKDAGDDAEHPGDRVDVVRPRGVPEGSDGGGVGTQSDFHSLDPLPVGSELQVVAVQPAVVVVDPISELLELRVEVGPQGVEPGVESLEFGQDGLALSGSRSRPEVVHATSETFDLLGKPRDLDLLLGTDAVGSGDTPRLPHERGVALLELGHVLVEAPEAPLEVVVHDISFPHKG